MTVKKANRKDKNESRFERLAQQNLKILSMMIEIKTAVCEPEY